MQNAWSQGMLALMITIAAGVLDAGGSASQAGLGCKITLAPEADQPACRRGRYIDWDFKIP
jgi:hypothetical protein